jgi:hypothetical protein
MLEGLTDLFHETFYFQILLRQGVQPEQIHLAI